MKLQRKVGTNNIINQLILMWSFEQQCCSQRYMIMKTIGQGTMLLENTWYVLDFATHSLHLVWLRHEI